MKKKKRRIMLELRPLSDEVDLRELHALMVAENFPGTPMHFIQAQPYFAQSFQLGGFVEDELQVAFILGDITAQAAALDVVCAQHYRGRWAQRRALRALYDIAFVQLGVKFLWAETRNKRALRACVKAGFQFVNPPEATQYLLILTREDAARLLKISDMEHTAMAAAFEKKCA